MNTYRAAEEMTQLSNRARTKRKSGDEIHDLMSQATLTEFVEQATFLLDLDGRLVDCHGWHFAGGLIEGKPSPGEFLAGGFPEAIAAAICELLDACNDGGDRASQQVLSRLISAAALDRRVYRLTITVPTASQRILTIRDVTCEDLARRLKECQHQAAEKLTVLTTREVQVMRMVIRGLPNKVIANQLQLSIKTIEKYRSGIMRKLGLRSLCDLLRFWFRLAWAEELESA